jgi:hypothetical protein
MNFIILAKLDMSKKIGSVNEFSLLLLMFRVVFWDILPCKMIVDRRFIPDDGGSTHL